MNLIELMRHQVVFDALEDELKQFSQLQGFKYFKSETKIGFIRKMIRNLSLGSHKITNVKVTSKDKNKHIITFHSDNDRYYCIWDFAEGGYISRSVNR